MANEEEQELIDYTGGELLGVIKRHMARSLAPIFGEDPDTIAALLAAMPTEAIKKQLADVGFEITGYVGIALDKLRNTNQGTHT